MTGVVDVDDIPTTETESIIPTWIEEENPQEEVTEVNQAVQGRNPRMKVNPST
jgi:hypothetical protein